VRVSPSRCWGTHRHVRLLFAVVILMVIGLLAEAIFHSAVGAWIAFGSVIAFVAIGVLGKVGLWPASWPGSFGGED
jgi:hypothetical protein